MTAAPAPILSICIPAYGFEEGVRRIIGQLKASPRLEILVSEDTSDRPLNLSDFAEVQNFTHFVNSESKGAVANWNRVLSEAKGSYVWLLHHDEEPVFPNGLNALLDHLAEPDAPCLLLSRLEVRDRFWQRVLRLDVVRRIFLKFPKLVLIHNSIGSPSNCIVRRASALPFDERLQWFVDVEWYYRIILECDMVRLSHFRIRSHQYHGSITTGMLSRISETARSEVEIICNKHEISHVFRHLWRLKASLFELIKRTKRG